MSAKQRGSGFYVAPYNIGRLYSPLEYEYPVDLTPYEKGQWRSAWVLGHCQREIEDIQWLCRYMTIEQKEALHQDLMLMFKKHYIAMWGEARYHEYMKALKKPEPEELTANGE